MSTASCAVRTITPGPGHYQIVSEFGRYNFWDPERSPSTERHPNRPISYYYRK
jgi:hypothetical protein